MKKYSFVFLLMMAASCAAFAQDEEKEEKKGFKKENLFTGGSLSLGISNNSFGIGVNPEFGYSLASWADLGLVVNYNYTSYRDYYYGGGKLKQTIYGGGLFTRLYPVRFLFAQAQLEHNWLTQKFEDVADSKVKVSSNSLLVGAGYTTGRQEGKSVYGYLSVLFDVMGDRYSPYVDFDSYGNVRKVPIVRAGIIVPLFQGSNARY